MKKIANIKSQILIIFICFSGILTGQKNQNILPVISKSWNPFALNEVKLLPGSPFYNAQELDKQYILSLDIDRLIAHIYENNDLQPIAHKYGGWEAGGWGATFGHYLSACALMYASTGDTIFQNRSKKMIEKLSEIQCNTPDGWFLARREGFEKLRSGSLLLDKPDQAGQPWDFNHNGNWWYGIHKVLAGLRDSYSLTDNKLALEILIKLVNWINEWASDVNPDLLQAMLAVEHGGMNEVIADLYSITGKPEYLDLSRKFSHESVIFPISIGQDILDGRHANDQIPKFIGAARIYELSGEITMGNAAYNFWDIVIKDHTLVIGGNGLRERFGRPGEISKLLDYSSAETCGTYNMLKLSNMLFQQTGQTKYLDFYERGLYNQILGSQDPKTGGFVYFHSLRPGLFNYYSTPENSFWCCVGTGMENHAKYNEAIYFHNDKSLLINLFIPSVVDWKEMGFKATIESNFPEGDTVYFKVLKNEGNLNEILIRHPSWLKNKPIIFINNKLSNCLIKDNFIIQDNYEFKKGDEIKILLTQQLYLETVQDDKNMISILYGPNVLAVEMGNKDLPNLYIESPHDLNPFPKPINIIPEFVASKSNLDSWIKKDPKIPLKFHTAGAGIPMDVSLVPYYKIHHQRFSVYSKLYSPEEYDMKKFLVSDEIHIGDNSSEEKHKLKGKNTTLNSPDNIWKPKYPSRTADNGGWFSYRMKLNQANHRHFLVLTLWGDEPGNTEFDIMIEGQIIQTIVNKKQSPFSLRDEVIELPASLVKNKDTVEVKLQTKENKTTGGIYGIRIQNSHTL